VREEKAVKPGSTASITDAPPPARERPGLPSPKLPAPNA